jgi:hypothetical protein
LILSPSYTTLLQSGLIFVQICLNFFTSAMMDLREIDWLRRGQVSVQWIQLAQDRGQWWALVNEVMSLRVLTPQLVTSVIGSTFCFLPAFSCS